MKKYIRYNQDGSVAEEIDVPQSEHIYKDVRENRIKQGVAVGGLTINGDDQTMLRLAGARIKAESDSSFTTVWNGDVTLNASQIIAASDAMAIHVDKAFKAYGAVKGNTYNTIAEMEVAFDSAYNQA